jgi:hypothetical protein
MSTERLGLFPEPSTLGMKVTPFGMPELETQFMLYCLVLMRRKDYVVAFEEASGFRPALLTPHLTCEHENHNGQFFDWIATNFWNADPGRQ